MLKGCEDFVGSQEFTLPTEQFCFDVRQTIVRDKVCVREHESDAPGHVPHSNTTFLFYGGGVTSVNANEDVHPGYRRSRFGYKSL